MKDDAYGTVHNNTVNNEAQRVAEEVAIIGFSKVGGVLDKEQLTTFTQLIDDIYTRQEAEFGRQTLLDCNEADQARCLTRYDKRFFDLLKHPRLSAISHEILGEYATLMLQNAVLSRPQIKNHQSAWHRDLPYQNFVCSEALAFNMLVVIDRFDEISGGTEVLPYSHKLGRLPSVDYLDKHKLTIIADPGDVLVFDSMLYHRAGQNRSSEVRRTMNNQLSKPFIKPQYRLDEVVPHSFIDNEADRRLLGITSNVAEDERDWRIKRIKRSQQK